MGHKVLIETLHKEDIKAAIRKRYRSIAAFERAKNLGKGSVSEILRGGANRRTTKAVERVLREECEGGANTGLHIITCDTAHTSTAHRLNAEAR